MCKKEVGGYLLIFSPLYLQSSQFELKSFFPLRNDRKQMKGNSKGVYNSVVSLWQAQITVSFFGLVNTHAHTVSIYQREDTFWFETIAVKTFQLILTTSKGFFEGYDLVSVLTVNKVQTSFTHR